MKKLPVLLLLLCLALAPAFCARAETARELKPAHLTATVMAENLPRLFDRSYFTIWYAKRGYMQVTLASREAAHGVYICFHKHVTPIVIQVPDGAGGFRDYKTVSKNFLHQYVDLPGVNAFRIRIADESKQQMLELAELRVFGPGQTPDWVQRWRSADKADLMVLCGHPDDELLWFGGTIPYYAGERQLHVQVVYLCRGDAWRFNELLDGLWMCGVRDYPTASPFQDKRTMDRTEVYHAWGGKKALDSWFVSVLRRYRPEVLVAQDFKGEYGHGVHQAAAYAAAECPTQANDPAFDPASAARYGVWQVKKIYIHLYRSNRIVMNWQKPLRVFGGRTGVEMANLALECHKSQQPIGYAAQTSGRYDCRRFGLYQSAVGLDVKKNDFFEHLDGY